MKKFMLILLTLSTLCSCQFIIKQLMGISDPQIESVESLSAYMEKHSMPSEYLKTVKDSMSCTNLLNLGGAPDAYFFDSQKRYVEYRENKETCNSHVSVFIKNIPNNNNFNYNYDFDYYEIVNLMHHADTILADTSHYDFTIIMVWFKWMGKVDKLADWEKELNALEKKEFRIRRIYLCGDYMNYMNISNPDDLGFDFKLGTN